VLYLGYASLFILKEVCPICVTTYVAVIGVFLSAGGVSSVPLSSLPRRVPGDVRVLVTRPVALLIAMLFLGGAGSAIAFFPHPQQAASAPQAPVPALTADKRAEFARWWDAQDKVDVPYPNDGAKVLVVKFNDYQCPPCRQTYYAYESIFAKYKPSDVKYVMKHFPLDPKCNPAVRSLVHPAACDAAAAAVMARSKGTFDKLTAWFFAHQEALTPATVRPAARDVGGIADFDAEYPKAIQEVRTEASAGGVLGVTSTPTFFINGRRIKGGLPPEYFEAALEIELKRAR
jgi:protein-disulfide isomerase